MSNIEFGGNGRGIHPRMSVNALTRYLTANAAQRETILEEQKYPDTFRSNWYVPAQRAIVRYLLDDERDDEILIAAEARIRETPAATRNEVQRRNGNVSAIASFRRCANTISFDGLTPERGPRSANIQVEGVTISVRPDIILTGQYRNDDCYGGIKLYIKNDRLGVDGAAIVGAALQRYFSESLPDEAVCNARHCLVVDVLGSSCTRAPRAIVMRQREINAACREIALRWPTI